MADKSVFIEGIAEGAFSELPEWATEKTALELEKYLRKSFDVQSKMLAQLIKGAAAKGQALTSEEMKKVNDEVEKFGRSLKRNNEEDAKLFKKRKDRNKQEEDALAGGKKKAIADNLLAKTFSGLSAMGGKVLGTYKEYFNIYDALYTSGINALNGVDDTSNGFESLNRMVNLTGLSLETFQKVASKYTSSMNAVGVQKFSKAMNLSAESFRKMGYSSEQQAELMGALMESEVGFLRIQNKSSAEIAKDAEELGKQLDKLSKVVGISREQLQENIKDSNKSANAYLIEFKYGIEARQKFTQFTAAFPAEMKGLLEEALAVDSPEAQSSLIRDLHAATLGDLAPQIMMALKQGAINPEEGLRMIKEISETLQKTGRMRQLASFVESQEGKRGAELISLFTQMGSKVSKATDKQVDNAQKTQESVSRFNTEIERASSTLQAAFMPLVSQVNAAANALKTLNDFTRSQIANVEAETRSWIGIGVALAGFVAGLLAGKNIIGAFTKGAGNFSTIATTIGNSLKWLGGILFRIATPLLLFYSVIQLATSIGETISEMVFGIEGTVDYIDAIKGVAKDLWGGILGIWNSVTRFATEMGNTIGKYISVLTEKISSAGLYIYNGIIGFGKKIIEMFPWIGTIGEYIQKAVGFIGSIVGKATDYIKQVIDPIAKVVKEIIEFGKSYVEVLKDFVKTVLSKFINKMSFGLIGGDKDKNVTNQTQPNTAQSPNKAGVNPVIVMVAPNSLAVPNSPAASKIGIPTPEELNKEIEKAMPKDASSAPLENSKPVNSGTKPPSDINNLLSYQGNLLEQILLSTNDLVSVNKEILRYSRNGV